MKVLVNFIITTVMAIVLLPGLAGAMEKEKIFIQTPKVAGIEATEAESYSAIIAKAADEYGLFETSTFDDLTSMLDLDQQKELLGCDDNSCMIEIRNAIGARYVIKSNISKTENGYLINLAFIDSEDFKIIARATLSNILNAALAIGETGKELLNQAVTVLFPDQAEEIVRQHPVQKIIDPVNPKHNGLKAGAIALGVTGGALLITGGVMGGLAQKTKNEARQLADDPATTNVNDVKQLYSKNRALGTTSYIMYGIGGGLAITSVVMGIVHAKKQKSPAVSLVPEFSRRQLMLTLSGNF